MKIGIYGGTFNPIHYGHLRTAQEVLEMLSLDKILFIPSGKPPFEKPGLEKAIHRYRMAKAAIQENPRFEISGLEMRTSGKAFTVDTLRKLRKKYPHSELFFILGIDTFLDLPKWKQPDLLVGLTNFAVISRPGYEFKNLSSSRYLKDVSRKALRELDAGKNGCRPFEISGSRKGYLCSVTGLDISASHIRHLLTAGKNIKYLLPDSVESYIISHGLYKGDVMRDE